MAFTVEDILLVGSILLFVSIIASKTSGKVGVPVLALFLGVGMLAGSDGIGKIAFDDPQFAQTLGVIALTFILFSGGLDTKWESIKPILWRGVSLSTIGVLATAILVGVFATFILNFTLIEGLLLGAIVSSTDAAAVFSILRSKSIGLKRNLRPTLELESGSNDPMAYFLTITFTYLLVNPDVPLLSLVPGFFIQMFMGAAIGYLMGRIILWIVNKINLDYEGLYPVLILSMVLFTYAATNYINGNGFLAVYLTGVVLGNKNFIHKRSLIRFYDGIAWLMQIVMFIALGLLVFPKQLVPVAGTGILLSLFLIIVARPAGVFLSLAFFKMKTREKAFISWVGLRGAVPIVFATYPLIAGVSKSDIMFNLVFFIVLTSVMLQATTLALVAGWLKLSVPEKLKRKSVLDIELSDDIRNELLEVEIPADSPIIGKSIVELQFPKTSLIVLINRKDKFITPNGATEIEANDKMMIMTDHEKEIDKINEILGIHEVIE